MSSFHHESDQENGPDICVQTKIKTVLDEEGNRSAVFACDVKAGEIIFSNAPFNAPQLDIELRGERCSYCFCKPNLEIDEKLSSCSRCSAAFIVIESVSERISAPLATKLNVAT